MFGDGAKRVTPSNMVPPKAPVNQYGCGNNDNDNLENMRPKNLCEISKEITSEDIEDLKQYIDAALKLNLLFIIYNENVGTKEKTVNIYHFKLIDSMKHS